MSRNNGWSNNKSYDKNQGSIISFGDMYGKSFINSYYQIMDFNRENISQFYRNKSKIQWNGQNIDLKLLESFFTKIPQSRHTIKSLNIQPILPKQLNKQPTILITVNGIVSYLGSESIPFSHTLIITTETNNINNNNNSNKIIYYALSDIFRTHQDIGN